MNEKEQELFFEPVVANMALLRLAENKILNSIGDSPADLNLRWQLAETYRKQGRLSEAALLYRQLEVSQFHKSLSKDLGAILTGCLDKFIGSSQCGPVPFLLQENFLNPNELSDLLTYIQGKAWENKRRSTVNAAEYDSTIRQSYDLDLPAWLKEIFLNYISHSWEELLRSLNIKHTKISKIDISLRAYSDGNFFRLHTDRNARVSRLLSMAYFFYFEPKQFDGGDLLVFDTNLSDSSMREFSHNFTRIQAQQNTLVIFPSASYHAVSEIQSKSGDLGCCRYAINVHVWEKKDDC
tara:strand:+ start:5367 stop:6251 length:885 start_codon:yes stop_codon:yes gene_type:complete